MGRIYLGKNSYFGLPNPKSKGKKALYNILAQAIDFLDGDTVVYDRKRHRYIKAKFTASEGRGKRKVSFSARTKIIESYAPKYLERALEEIKELAKKYEEGKISKKQFINAVKRIVKRYGLTDREIEYIIRKVKSKD